MIKRLFLIVLITVVPHVVSALEPYAIVTVPVANLREEPRHGSELMSQGVLGTPVEVISSQGEWLKIRMPDGYEGYMIGNSVALMPEERFRKWQNSSRGYVTSLSSRIVATPEEEGMMVSPLQLADIVQLGEVTSDGQYIHVYLPDGREGYSPATDLSPFEPFGKAGTSDIAEIIISRGKQLLGQEYLWGGTSAKANDCSGFTRILYQSAGVYLPRDAWQQALAGEEVTANDLQPGDLIFFSNAKGRVNHVGIYIGDGMMLHSSGRVRIDRILPSANGDTSGMYPKRPSKYRRILTGKSLESDVKANQIYFNK